MAKSLRILSPHDGDVLNRHDGQLSAEALVVPVAGTTPFGAPVTVNGIPGDVVDETFTCAVPLSQGEEAIEACAGGVATRISVLCDYNSQPRYRFSVDDNIEWLADLAQHPDEFDSLFDHWFLAFWQQLHREYNTKVHFNLYYQTVDQRFNLSQFPEKWREDFEQNSDWLQLSFHALQDKPDRIYKDATYDQLAHDFELVMDDIKRLAGEAVTSRVTTVHWAEAPREACRALVDRGVDILIGLFGSVGGFYTTRYYLDMPTAEYVSTRDTWKDNSEDIVFVACDAVVNTLSLEEVSPHIEKQAADPHTGEMLELLIHEQYFRADLPDLYQPDVMQKAEWAIRWVSEHGYEPCFWGEGLLGSPE